MIDLPPSVAVRTQHLSKEYHLGVLNQRSFREELLSKWQKLRRPSASKDQHLPPYQRVESSGLFHALQDISVDIQKGETVGLIGRNGAGKSTFLKLLARITAPTAGQALIRGRIGALLEVGTGFHPELTGRENIFLNGVILGMKKREIIEKFDEIVEFSEIGDFLDTPVKRYSSGMYVKLGFSIASSLRTDILLLDEVLAVGDAAFRKKSLARMKQVASDGRTILFVSHSVENIRAICSRCLLFEDGLIAMDGPTESVLEHYHKQG